MPGPLEALQEMLGEAFRREAPVAEDPGLAARCAEHVKGNDRLTPAEQVDLYRRQFWMRHLGSLEEDYPGLRALLGAAAFEAFCRAYLQAHPPASFTLRDLGDDIVTFAEGHAGFPEGQEALCRELVRYEHAFIDVLDGAEPPPLDPARLAVMTEEDWGTARVVLHPLLRRFRLAYPVHEIRDAARAGSALPEVTLKAVCLLLFRRDLTMRWMEVDPLALTLLDALARGVPLLPACELCAAGLSEEETAQLGERVQGWFAHWASSGLIVNVAHIAPQDAVEALGGEVVPH
ncbi:HvfC/BufC N-terminal domain-containing protein [Chondromyces apiculatus]|uniref:Putative DNA-binding domain-containing protein n=1 Tax=Chondromyces apiculatus DSM 436 TaxID=1192034 RepID=A0A017SY69_9BACT|nr:DNA-binding domain-containing protein [Chondromyces apiculatus]EYF01530.1 Hypothetical protein CAP_8091 [Chondromyces apiculatus DSM 436]